MKTQKRLYNQQFYQTNRNDAKLRSVDLVLAELMKIIPECHSAVDFGCATGTWLKGLEQYGISDVRGYDGKWVDQSKLLISKESFVEADFDKPMVIDRKFDLAISIEVAEHLQESSADAFIENITNSADFVLFSAAIPFQGGANHVNEQWPEYWYRKFRRLGFVCVDYIRKALWDNYEVVDFYRQNVLLYVKKERTGEINCLQSDVYDTDGKCPMAVIPPDTYLKLIKYKRLLSFLQAPKNLLKKTMGEKNFNKMKERI
ncbi:MAG: class I SAM-dependent methyltransferase [Tannerella sp.]|jgi:hypothetical protein|nr:class I SAM-dependent methyltransferase [Tannerella sp.]